MRNNDNAQESTTGGTVRHNTAQNGVEVKFSARPDQDALTWLHGHGFRWSRPQRLWYARYRETLLTAARERFTDDKTQEQRDFATIQAAEQGMERACGIR